MDEEMDAVFKTENAIFNYRVAGVWLYKNHVLLHRDVNDFLWSLPGGRVKIGEDSQNAIKREFEEELGIKINVGKLIWSVENFFEYNSNKFHEIGFYYFISNVPKDFDSKIFNGKEGDRLIYRWTPIEELPSLELYPKFLKTELKVIPSETEHFVVKDG